jgi:hypothetical protein
MSARCAPRGRAKGDGGAFLVRPSGQVGERRSEHRRRAGGAPELFHDQRDLAHAAFARIRAQACDALRNELAPDATHRSGLRGTRDAAWSRRRAAPRAVG